MTLAAVELRDFEGPILSVVSLIQVELDQRHRRSSAECQFVVLDASSDLKERGERRGNTGVFKGLRTLGR